MDFAIQSLEGMQALDSLRTPAAVVVVVVKAVVDSDLAPRSMGRSQRAGRCLEISSTRCVRCDGQNSRQQQLRLPQRSGRCIRTTLCRQGSREVLRLERGLRRQLRQRKQRE